MSDGQRNLALLLAATVAVVVGFFVVKPGSSDTTVTTTSTAVVTTTPTTPNTPTPEPIIVITVKDGKPVGGIKEIEVKKGDHVRFEVVCDSKQEIHVHGYDISEDAAPGSPARFDFTATLEGVFEVELEASATQIVKLTVSP